MSAGMDEHGATVVDGEGASFSVGPLSRTDFVRFAGAGGDFNPVHHDEVYARANGFPSVFAMGMFTASLASRLVTDWFGLENIRSYTVRFVASVWPEETLIVSGRIVGPVAEDGLTRVELNVVNQSGEIKITGAATVKAD